MRNKGDDPLARRGTEGIDTGIHLNVLEQMSIILQQGIDIMDWHAVEQHQRRPRFVKTVFVAAHEEMRTPLHCAASHAPHEFSQYLLHAAELGVFIQIIKIIRT